MTRKSFTLLRPQFLFLEDEKQTPSCQQFRILSLFVGTALRSKHRKFPNHLRRRIGLQTGGYLVWPCSPTGPGSAQPALHSPCCGLFTAYTTLEVPPREDFLPQQQPPWVQLHPPPTRFPLQPGENTMLETLHPSLKVAAPGPRKSMSLAIR